MNHPLLVMDKHKPKVGFTFIVIFLIIIGVLLFLGRSWGMKEQQKDKEDSDKNVITEELYRKQ